MTNRRIGLATPFQRDGQRDFGRADGTALLVAEVKQVLCTWGTTPYGQGEMPWRTDFGSSLHLLPHTNWEEATAEMARVWIRDALSGALPDVALREVHFEQSGTCITAHIAVQQSSRGDHAINIALEMRHAF